MNWSRRELLSTVAGGSAIAIAGCNGPGDAETTTERTTTAPATDGPPATDAPTDQPTPLDCESPSIDAADAAASSFAATVETADGPDSVVVEAGTVRPADEAGPARIVVAVQNASRSQREFQFGYTPPLGGLSLIDDDGDATIELWPDEPYDEESAMDRNDDGELQVLPDERTDGCWQAVDQPIGPDYFETVTLSSCETLSRTYALLSHPDNDGCFPAGTYQRTDRVTRRDTGETFELSLTVTVS